MESIGSLVMGTKLNKLEQHCRSIQIHQKNVFMRHCLEVASPYLQFTVTDSGVAKPHFKGEICWNFSRKHRCVVLQRYLLMLSS